MIPRLSSSMSRPRSHLLANFLCLSTMLGNSFFVAMPMKRATIHVQRLATGFGAETPKAKKTLPADCPCLSGKLYRDCCRPFHKDPSSVMPEQLARARYSALALKKYDFLIETTHPSHPDYQEDRVAWKKTMAYNNRGFRYVGLNVTASEVRAEDLHAVTIEAASEPEKHVDLPEVVLVRECSIYRLEGDAWKYLKAEELKCEVVKGASSVRQLSN